MKISQSESKRIAREKKHAQRDEAKPKYFTNPFVKVVIYIVVGIIGIIWAMIKSGYKHEFWRWLLGK
jgi:hypothetical protein